MFRQPLDFFRSIRARTMSMTETLTQTQLDYAPSSGAWSVGEVLDHLLLSERFYGREIAQLIEMKKAGRKPVLTRSFAEVNVSIGYLPKFVLPFLEVPFTVLNRFVPASVRETMTRYRLVPAQNPDLATPRKRRPAAELRQGLAASLKQTEVLFESNQDLDFREMRHRHPLMGDNHVLQLLRFVAVHEQRHQSQIADILRNPRFPKAA